MQYIKGLVKGYLCCVPLLISIYDRIIPTICKHVVANKALAGGGVGICVDEAADLGIIVTGLEVIELGISVVALATDPKNSLSVQENSSSPEGKLLPLWDLFI